MRWENRRPVDVMYRRDRSDDEHAGSLITVSGIVLVILSVAVMLGGL